MLPTLASSPRLCVLGVDPGTRLMGWGVVEGAGGRYAAAGHGVLRAPSGGSIAARLHVLATGLRDVVARYRPAEAALEDVFFGKDAHAAVRIGEGRGAALLVLAEAGVHVTGYANNVVKKAVAGGGRADKERVLTMLKRVLGLETRPETLDASDALALALCHHQRRGLAREPGGIPARLAEAIARARRSP
jgi:crossover junction endodeoxyribonuclease RuvC